MSSAGSGTTRPRALMKDGQLRRILGLFRPYRRQLLSVVLLVAGSSLVALVNPFLIREIMDTALPQDRLGLLSLLSLGMIMVSVTTSSFNVWQTHVSATVGQLVMHDLRTAVYSHLQRMSLAFFARTRTGEVQSRISNDIGGMQVTITTTATALLSDMTVVIAATTAMFLLDWRLTLASMLMLPAFALVSRRVGNERRNITRDRQRQLAELSSTMQESLSISGILLSHTMGRSRSLTDNFARQSRRLTDVEVRVTTAGLWYQSTIWIVIASMPAMIYWVSGLTSNNGHMAISIGSLVAFTSLQQSLFRPAQRLLTVGIEIQGSLELFGRIFEYLDLPVDIAEPERPVEPAALRGRVRMRGSASPMRERSSRRWPTST